MKTFREYLIQEDLNGDIEALKSKISALTSQKAKLIKPLDDQLNVAQKLLAAKARMLPLEQKKQQQQTQTPQNQQQPTQNQPNV